MRKALDKKHITAAVAGLTVVILAVCFGVISGQDNFLQRWLYDQAQRHSRAVGAEHVVIVAIDDDSRAKLGEWPWPNSIHAKLIEQLRSAGARSIAFTTPLSESRPDVAGGANNDQLLLQAMQHQGRVLLPLEVSTRVTGDSLLPALEPVLQRNRVQTDAATLGVVPSAQSITSASSLLNGAYAVGHLLEPIDSDGVTRRELLAVRLDDQVLPALSLALASTSVDAKSPQFSATELQLSPDLKKTAIQRGLSFLPRVEAETGVLGIPQFSYWRVLNGTVLSSNLRDKLVLVGFTDGLNADRVQTAVGSLPRISLIASATESLLSGTAYSHPWWTRVLQLLLSAAVVALVTLALLHLPRKLHLIAAACVALGLLVADFLLMRASNVSLQVAPVCVALIVSALLAEALRSFAGATSSSNSPAISMDTLKTLALTLHGQGQLDLAYETLRRCPVNSETLELMYRLGVDYERRQERRKAAQVFSYIAQRHPGFKDAQQRGAELMRANMPLQAKPAAPSPASAAPRPSALAKSSAAVAVQREPEPDAQKEFLGRYEVLKQIGKGAMGVVYLGRDPKINRVVAIKAIPLAEEFEDQDLVEARERFFREAEMAGRLNHPGIVTIHDAGEDHGLAYIAMEFVQGEHLSYYCDPKRLLPVRKALSLVVRVAEALNYAHRQNVVHRDIKPANIMFNIETDALKITDFGIARLADVSRTKTGIVLGTPSFMSPEQLEGRPLDGRSDLFALGVTMYQLLTGVLPFRADSMTRLMNKIATEPHPPMRSIRPELPASLDEIMDRALAKAAEDRYQSGAELAEALRTCMRTIAP